MSGFAPLIGPERQDSEFLRQTGHELLQSSFIDSLTAGVASDFTAPGSTASLLRLGEMDSALGQTPQVIGRGGFYPQPKRTPLTAEDWKSSSDFRSGLSYFDGMTSEAAKLLAERHDAEAARQDTMNRYRGGLAGQGLQYAARFAAMLADPINIASAFLPVVGEMQAARLAAQLGRFGGRAATGAIEGMVGQALLEPLAQASAHAYQEDYGMLDSLTNVALGGLLGAGLHAGLGAIGDAFGRRGGPGLHPKDRAAVADVAIKQMAAGRDIQVADILWGEYVGKVYGVDAPRAPRSAKRLEGQRAIEGPADPPLLRAPGEEPARPPPGPDAATAGPSGARSFDERRQDAITSLEEAYQPRDIPLPSGDKATIKGPMDLLSFLRTIGGVRDDGGRLADIGGDLNAGRQMPFAAGEDALGPLLHDTGTTLEAAAQKAVDAGYLPKGAGAAELQQAIERTMRYPDMTGRVWRAEDAAPLRDYAERLKAIDAEERSSRAQQGPPQDGPFRSPEPERHAPLREEDRAQATEADLAEATADDAADDPEALFREELEREAAAKAEGPEQPGDKKPAAAGAEKPLTPEQQVAELKQKIEAGTKAAAACIARTRA